MSLTPNRDAVDAAHAEARILHAGSLSHEDARGIGTRMMLETAAAIQGGLADMLDRHLDPDEFWPMVAGALGRSLACHLMTVTNGDKAFAELLLGEAIASVREVAQSHLRQGQNAFVVKSATMPRGGSS